MVERETTSILKVTEGLRCEGRRFINELQNTFKFGSANTGMLVKA